MNSYSRILHGNIKCKIVVVDNFAAHRQRNRALLCVLNRVRQYIRDNLLDSHIVAEKNFGEIRVDFRYQRQLLFVCLLVNHINKIVNQIQGIVADGDNFHFAVFDFGKVKNAVD